MEKQKKNINTPLLANEEGTSPANLLPLRDKDLPPISREIVTNAPLNRKIPSFIASLPALCAIATRVRLKYYYDSRPSALLLQVITKLFTTTHAGKTLKLL